MFVKRHLLPIALLALAGAGLVPVGASAAELRSATADIPLGSCGAFRSLLFLDFKVPVATAPGEAVVLTDVQATFGWRSGVTTLPGSYVPERATGTVRGLSFKVEGGVTDGMAVAAVPQTLPAKDVGDFRSDGYGYNVEAKLGSTTPVVTAGADPLVVRLDRYELSTLFEDLVNDSPGFPGSPSGPSTKETICTPAPDARVVAIIPSTGPQPAPPRLTSLTPNNGPVAGGNTITLKGTGFRYITAVRAGGELARKVGDGVTVKDAETIEVTMPASSVSRETRISVVTAFGETSSLPYLYGEPLQPLPTITSVSPNRFPTTAGILNVTIRGTGLDRLTSVLFLYQGSGATVMGHSADGTSAQIRLLPGEADWTTNHLTRVLGLQVYAGSTCGFEVCESVDTPGDDITFFEPVDPVPGFPAKPASLTGARSGNIVSLKWAAGAGGADVVGYEIFQNGRSILRTTEPETSEWIQVDDPARTYRFAVRAIDREDNRSPLSDAVIVAGTAVDVTPPPTPSKLFLGEPGPNEVSLSWVGDDDRSDVAGYEVFQDGVKVKTVPKSPTVLVDLDRSKSHRFKVRAFDAAGNGSAFGAEQELLARPCAGSGCGPEPTVQDYAVTGSATLKSLVKGSVPLKGALNGVAFDAAGAFSGALALEKSSATLTAYGFLPVSAQLQLVATEPLAGTLTTGAVSASTKLRVKLPKVSLLGVQIGGGSNCQAKQLSPVALKSTNAFSAATGGVLAGTFTISDLSGCGALNGLVSPLTAGKGNAIVLNLAPKAATPTT